MNSPNDRPRRRPSLQSRLSASSLPRGNHGLPREVVEESQRRRLIGAAAEAHLEEGLALTVVDVCRRAGVAKGTFYKLFENKYACLVAGQERALGRFAQAVTTANAFATWDQRITNLVAAAVDLVATDPAGAYLLLPDPEDVEASMVPAIEQFNWQLIELLRQGRAVGEVGDALPQYTELTLIAGVRALIAACVRSGQLEHLDQLRVELARIICTPYLSAGTLPG